MASPASVICVLLTLTLHRLGDASKKDKLASTILVPLKSTATKSLNKTLSHCCLSPAGVWEDVMATHRKGMRSRRAKKEKMKFARSDPSEVILESKFLLVLAEVVVVMGQLVC